MWEVPTATDARIDMKGNGEEGDKWLFYGRRKLLRVRSDTGVLAQHQALWTRRPRCVVGTCMWVHRYSTDVSIEAGAYLTIEVWWVENILSTF